MARRNRIAPCLWFDSEALAAAKFYVKIFPNSRIREIMRYGKAGQEQHRQKPGSVMVVEFELDGQTFTALNGGPIFKHSPAASIAVMTEDQAESDRIYSALVEGGEPQPCGWLTDRCGLSWQVFPRRLVELTMNADADTARRATEAMLKQTRIDIAEIERAAAGN